MDDYAQYGVALLILDRVVGIVRALRGKTNGHSEVRPQDAVDFWTLHKGMDAKLDLIDRKVDKLIDRA